jgi:hypothetical protein
MSPNPSLRRGSGCAGPTRYRRTSGGRNIHRYAFPASCLPAANVYVKLRYAPDLSPAQKALLSSPRPLGRLSQARLVRLRPGPLFLLERACRIAVPLVAAQLATPPASRVDYSFNNPHRSLRLLRSTDPSRRLANPSTAYTGPMLLRSFAVLDVCPTLASITAKMIENKWYIGASDPRRVPNLKPAEHALLSNFDLNESFPCWWADVIANPVMEKSLDMIAARLDAMQPATARTVPLFVILFLLKRQRISPSSLQRLLGFAWRILRNTEVIPEQQVVILFKRLMRHAQRVWHAGIINIAALITTFIPFRHSNLLSPLPPTTYLRYCDLFNHVLTVLALPGRRSPYKTIDLRVMAQSMVLTRMVQFEKPLSLNSSGFRALVRTQLARPKNSKELDWANLQSRSWPPHLEPKTHMDEGKGFADGTSRALLTLSHMRAAGYASPAWDKIVRIYAGWDVDYSPTVQTRKVLDFVSPKLANEQAAIFAARINVTRDIKEAWSFFLQYYDSQLPPNSIVYEAMLRKAKAEKNRQESWGMSRFEAGQVPAGESLELLQAAVSPRQRVYTATEPDGVMELFHRMLRDGVQPREHLKGLFVKMAPDLSTAIMVWHILNGPTTGSFTSAACTAADAGGMSRHVLSAFLHQLTKNPLSTAATALFTEEERQAIRNLFQGPASGLRQEFRLDWFTNLADCGLFQAIYLLRQCQLHNRQDFGGDDWGQIFEAVKTIVADNRRNWMGISGRWLAVVEMILDEVSTSSSMFDSRHFHHLCSFVERAARGARASGPDRSWMRSNQDRPFTLALASHMLRRAFALMTATAATEPELAAATAGLPAETPPIPRAPTDLRVEFFHVYVRALMLCDDHEGVYGFVRWIAAHEGEVAEAVRLSRTGPAYWGRFLAVVRVYADKERHSGRTHSHHALFDIDPVLLVHIQAPTRELAELIYQCLQGLEKLDGWATDQEVADYFKLESYSANSDSPVSYHIVGADGEENDGHYATADSQ